MRVDNWQLVQGAKFCSVVVAKEKFGDSQLVEFHEPVGTSRIVLFGSLVVPVFVVG